MQFFSFSIILKNNEILYEEIIRKGYCVRKQDLAINGNDLISLGMKPGKELGEELDRLFAHVLAVPEHNTKEKLLQLAHK